MAFGISPKYEQEFNISDSDPARAYIQAIEIVKELGWSVGYYSEAGFIAYTNFSLTSWGEEIKVKINEDTIHLKSECTGAQIFDWGKNKKNIHRFISSFQNRKAILTDEEIKSKYNELSKTFISGKEDILNRPALSRKEKITGIFSIFKPIDGYFVTPILIGVNFLIFFIMVISGVNFFKPDLPDLINWGANLRPLTVSGDYWRLLSSVFIHIGFFHLLLNMYALLFIGVLLEPYLGASRFLAAYLISGLAASVTSIFWHENTISAGASGAIFGMYGVFLAMLTTSLIPKVSRKSLLISIGIFVGYNLLNGMQPGIDNAAHIGGLLTGMVIGYAYYPSFRDADLSNLKNITIAGLATMVLIFSFIAVNTLEVDKKEYTDIDRYLKQQSGKNYSESDMYKSDLEKYNARMQKFFTNESMALEVYRLPRNTPVKKIMYEIKDRGIYYWKKNLEIVNSIDELHLPVELLSINDTLKTYCNLRIKAYELTYKTLNENTNAYDQELTALNQHIIAIINQLNEK
ncbi:MAG: rhomboid family intramembrane serine protease [Chlorobi bacterium]|nr:rhomboid family intramembrane serine protease [Chlorobiota bacterium]